MEKFFVSDEKSLVGSTPGFPFSIQVLLNLPQNLDYAFLMMYAQWRGVYYVQLEDDILTKVKILFILWKFIFFPFHNCRGSKSDQESIL